MFHFPTFDAAKKYQFKAVLHYGIGTYRVCPTSAGWVVEPCFGGYPARPFPIAA